MRIAICDDENGQIDLTAKHIRAWAKSKAEPVELFTYSSAEEFLFRWSEGENVEVIFLDIKMKKMTGIDLAHIIRKNNEDMIIIFITGMIDYVFQGYDVQALHYLIKPVKADDCFVCLDRALQILQMRDAKAFIVHMKGQRVRLNYDEIYSFEILSHYVRVNSKKGSFTFIKKITELEQELPGNMFFRCHRSFIVNVRYVNTIHKTEAFLDNDSCVPVSKSRWDKMNEIFMQYHAKEIMI